MCRIADFLNRKLSPEDIERIVERTDKESMRKNAMVNFAVQETVWNTDKSEGEFINQGNF